MFPFVLQELCLLGLVSRRWNVLIEGFMSHTFTFVPISKQYALHQIFRKTSQDECQDNRLDLEVCPILILCLGNSFAEHSVC
jgi:hypothetical protein